MYLQRGTPAPTFTAKDQNGKTVSLQDFAGKKLALYFYPADDTPSCTKQACNLRDNLRSLSRRGIRVIGVSPDSVKSHKKFKEKFSLNFPLIADEDHAILNAYRVWGPKQFMGRTFDGTHRVTYLIDEAGIIRSVIAKVVTKDHAAQVLRGFGVEAA